MTEIPLPIIDNEKVFGPRREVALMPIGAQYGVVFPPTMNMPEFKLWLYEVTAHDEAADHPNDPTYLANRLEPISDWRWPANQWVIFMGAMWAVPPREIEAFLPTAYLTLLKAIDLGLAPEC